MRVSWSNITLLYLTASYRSWLSFSFLHGSTVFLHAAAIMLAIIVNE